MATPNLINVDTITPKVAVGAVTTSRADIVDVTAVALIANLSVTILNVPLSSILATSVPSLC